MFTAKLLHAWKVLNQFSNFGILIPILFSLCDDDYACKQANALSNSDSKTIKMQFHRSFHHHNDFEIFIASLQWMKSAMI